MLKLLPVYVWDTDSINVKMEHCVKNVFIKLKYQFIDTAVEI